jgi:hypothetical protein
LRERLLGEREHIMVDAVAKLEQPASHASFDRVQRITAPNRVGTVSTSP